MSHCHVGTGANVYIDGQIVRAKTLNADTVKLVMAVMDALPNECPPCEPEPSPPQPCCHRWRCVEPFPHATYECSICHCQVSCGSPKPAPCPCKHVWEFASHPCGFPYPVLTRCSSCGEVAPGPR